MRNLWLLLVYFLTSIAYSSDYIPPKAYMYKDTIKTELDTYFPNIFNYNYVPSLIEHESCISLTHSKCWSSTSQLKTKRELGIGLGQITKAYRSDGSIRFDKLTELRNRYMNDLKEAKWETIRQRPDIQIRMIVIMLRDDYKQLYSIPNSEIRMQMTDAAYNGGISGVLRERRACNLAKDCNPNVWFGNVERYCLKSKKILYGTRSACDINRYHVKDVWFNKLPKYKRLYFNNKPQFFLKMSYRLSLKGINYEKR